MAKLSLHPVLALVRPLQLAGPIFTKELRVASRRKRNYALRLVYLGLLLAFAGFAWAAATDCRAVPWPA